MPLQNEEKFYLELGDRVKTERFRRDISQEKLAEELGLSRTSVANLEKGRHRPSIYQLMLIAEFFIIDFTDLIPVELTKKPRGVKKKKSLDEQLKNAVSDQNVIDNPTRSIVKEFLTSLTSDKK